MLVEFRSNMAASQAQPDVNNESESGIIHETPLSDYAKSLEGVVRKRYIDKISVIGVDPLLIPEVKFSTDCLPPVEPVDLVDHLEMHCHAVNLLHFIFISNLCTTCWLTSATHALAKKN